ncbi:VTT domain-containing protein [Sphingopyxis sp. BSN-002]|uniref:TVP38/TMEM64 family protein n=1 Tax=Sphingopyxis sp. BSN-002 TaxID=2911495 RepID=UPI001EDAE312|nr:VTT domain-containing protein [Sphingopyxis sp. BSN-002]UKK84068.1 VTT domain-containing protein [Sphingopyxis sp. BSN-002]
MAKRPAPLTRWLVIAALLMLVIGLPLIFRDQFMAASDAILAAADEQPVAAAAFIIAALTLDLFLPVPNGVTNTLAGAAFGFPLGTLVIWLGLMGASLAGYSFGRWAARPLAKRLLGADDVEKAHSLAERAGPIALILSRPVPVLAEIMSIAAGVAGMSFARFALVMALANLGVAALFAAIGAAAVEQASAELLMLGAVGLPLFFWLSWQGTQRWRTR